MLYTSEIAVVLWKYKYIYANYSWAAYIEQDLSIPLWLGGRLHMMLRLTRTISR
jgi:hypothetical protein